MARPQRNDVDYFPFYCKQGGTTEYVESAYGNDGFAVWVKILRELATTKYHFLNLADKKKAMPFIAKCKVSEDTLHAIISDLVELDEFDKELWEENKIVWSQKFTDSIEDAYKKRANKIVKREELIQLLVGLGVRKLQQTTVQGSVNPQRREENTKEEKSIEENIGARVLSLEKQVEGFETTFVPEPKELLHEVRDLKNALCEYFGIRPVLTSKSYTLINDFVDGAKHKNELKIVSMALKNYAAYKQLADESIHGIEKWIGTKDEFYQDGKWKEIDWEKKLKTYKGKSNVGTANQRSSSAVIEPRNEGFGTFG